MYPHHAYHWELGREQHDELLRAQRLEHAPALRAREIEQAVRAAQAVARTARRITQLRPAIFRVG